MVSSLDRHRKACGGGLEQHLAGGAADLALRDPVLRRRERAAGDLAAIAFLVGVALFDGDLGPVGVEFFRDQHRKHRLDALTDLRVLRHDADRAVGRDRDEVVHVDDGLFRHRRTGGDGGAAFGRVRRHAAGEGEAALLRRRAGRSGVRCSQSYRQP